MNVCERIKEVVEKEVKHYGKKESCQEKEGNKEEEGHKEAQIVLPPILLVQQKTKIPPKSGDFVSVRVFFSLPVYVSFHDTVFSG